MIIAIHNSKGGVGSTMLAAHMCEHAKEIGLRVTAVSANSEDGLLQWYEPSSVAFDPESSGADIDLMVIDVRSDGVPPIEPDVWVVPICERLSLENAVELSDRLRGHLIWLGNKGYTIEAVPKYLEDDVEVALAVPYSRALERSSVMRRVAWTVPELALAPGSRAIRASLDDILRHAYAGIGTSLEKAVERAQARRQAADILATIQRMTVVGDTSHPREGDEDSANVIPGRRALTAGEVLSMATSSSPDDLERSLHALVQRTRAQLGQAAVVLDAVDAVLASATAHRLVNEWLGALLAADRELSCGVKTASEFVDLLQPGVHHAGATGLCRQTLLRFAAQPGRARLGTLVRIVLASGRGDLLDLRPASNGGSSGGSARLRSVR